MISCRKTPTKVGDLVSTSTGKVGVVTSLRGNGSADIVWLDSQSRGLVNLFWLYLFSKS